MELTHAIGKHTFKIVCDKDDILRQLQADRNYYEEGYVPYGEDDSVGISREQYEKNIDEMISTLDVITTTESLIGFIEDASKKKNGTFSKGRIVYREGCGNTSYICEWHNTWIYDTLVVRATDDLCLTISYESYTDTPG